MRKNNFTENQAQYFDLQAKLFGKEKDNFAGNYEFNSVLSFLNISPPAEILEIGCGTGRYTLRFLRKGFDVYGVDISSDSLTELGHEYKKKATAKWGKLKTARSIPDNIKFDVAICVNILHHLEDPSEMVSSIRACLKEKGIIFIFEPNPLYFPWYILFMAKGIMELEKNIIRSNIWEMKKMLSQQRFRNIMVKPYGLFPTRLMSCCPAVLDFTTSFLPKLPVIRLFTFHNMIKAEN